MSGTGSFSQVCFILMILLGMYGLSALPERCRGWIMADVSDGHL